MADIFGEDSDSDDEAPFSKPDASSNSAANIFGSDSDDSDSDDGGSKKKRKRLGKKKKEKKEKVSRKRKEKRPHSPSDEPAQKRKPSGDSGDEYDSGEEVVKTKEDNDFLASDSDDDLGLGESYGGDQNFKDDKPEGYDSDQEARRKKRSGGGAASSHSRKANSDNPLDQALARISAGKRKPKKDVGSDDRRLNEYIADFLQKMDDQAKSDRQTHRMKQPAVGKLNMLPQVLKMIKNKGYQRNLLEMNLLEAVHEWLTPLDDGALASHTVRVAIYEVLMELPVEVDHLKRSGLGKLIMGLWHHPKETKENKAKLKALIERWARPVFNKFTDHRGDEEVTRVAAVPKSKKKLSRDNGDVSLKLQSVGNEAVDTQWGMVKSDRVQIPRPLNFNFKKRVQHAAVVASDKKLDPETRRGRLDKKSILAKRMKKKNDQRAVSCSIEGRGTD